MPNAGPPARQTKLFKADFIDGVKNYHEEAVPQVEPYWLMLTGHKPKLRFIILEDIWNNSEKFNRIKNHCQEEIIKIDTDTKNRAVALYTLKAICLNENHQTAVIMMDHLTDRRFAEGEVMAVLVHHFPELYRQAAVDRTIDFFWLQFILGTAALSADTTIADWGIHKCYHLGQREEYWALWRPEFFPHYMINAVDKSDFFYRLIASKRIDEVLSSMKNVFRMMAKSAGQLEMFITSFVNLHHPYAVFHILASFRDVEVGPVLDHTITDFIWKFMYKCVDKLALRTMSIFAIRQVIVFFAKVTKLDIHVLNVLADIIGRIAIMGSPDYTEKILEEVKSIIVASGYKTDESLSLESYLLDLREELNVEHAACVERGKIFWASLSNEPEKMNRMKTEIERKFRNIIESRRPDYEKQNPLKEMLPQAEVFILYLERPGGGPNEEFDEVDLKILKVHILSAVWFNKGYRHEFYSYIRVFMPLFLRDELILPITYTKFLERFKGCGNTVDESQALLLMFLDGMIDNQVGTISHQNSVDWMRWTGKNTKERIGKPKITFNSTLPPSDAHEFEGAVHQLRIKLFGRMAPLCGVYSDEESFKEFRKVCIGELNDKTIGWVARREHVNLLAMFIPFFPPKEAWICVNICDRVFTQEDVKSEAAWRALFYLQVNAYTSIRFLPDLIEPLLLLINVPFQWNAGKANVLPHLPLLFIDALTTACGYSWHPFARTIVAIATFKPNDTPALTDINLQKCDDGKAHFAFGLIDRCEGNVVPSIESIDAYHEFHPRSRIKAILLAIKFCSSGLCKKWSVELIKGIRHFGMCHGVIEVRRRALEMFLLLTGCPGIDMNEVVRFCTDYLRFPERSPARLTLLVEWALARACLKSKQVWESILIDAQASPTPSLIRVLLYVCRVDVSRCETVLDILTPEAEIINENDFTRRASITACRIINTTLYVKDEFLERLANMRLEEEVEPATEMTLEEEESVLVERERDDERNVEMFMADVFISKLNVEKHFSFKSVLFDIPRMTSINENELPPAHIIEQLTSQDSNYGIPVTGIPDKNFYAAMTTIYSIFNSGRHTF